MKKLIQLHCSKLILFLLILFTVSNLDTAKAQTVIPAPTGYGTLVPEFAYNGYVYLFGAKSASPFTRSIFSLDSYGNLTQITSSDIGVGIKPLSFTVINGDIYFTDINTGLWQISTSSNAAYLVYNNTYVNNRGLPLVSVGNYIFLPVGSTNSSVEVYNMNDGTVSALQINGFTSGLTSSITTLTSNCQFVAYNNYVYFIGQYSTSEYAVRSDGTTTGTKIVGPLNPHSTGSINQSYVPQIVNGKIIFSSPYLIALNPSYPYPSLTALTDNSSLLATISVTSYQNKMFISSGTDIQLYDGIKNYLQAASSTPLTGFLNQPNGSALTFNGNMFGINPTKSNTQLWESNGTTVGTQLVKDTWPSTPYNGSVINPVVYNGLFYFEAPDSTGTVGGSQQTFYSLWQSDGTNAGTVKISYSSLNLESPFFISNNTIYVIGGTTGQLYEISLKPSQTITFNPFTTTYFGSPDFDPGATSNSGLPVSYTSSDTTVVKIVNGLVHLVNYGSVNITATQSSGDGYYGPAAPVTQTLIVSQPPAPNLTFNNLPAQIETVGNTIQPIQLNNNGGPVPTYFYGESYSFAGSEASSGVVNAIGGSARFKQPFGLAEDQNGNVYVADRDNNLIRKISPSGVVTTWAGSGVAGAMNGNGTSASFNQPNGVAVDANGNVYVADLGNYLIRVIDPSGNVSTLAGSGTQGKINGNGTAAQFNYPESVAVDASGNVYVADGGGGVREIMPGGAVSTLLVGQKAAPGLQSADAITVDLFGNVFAADASRNVIWKINNSGAAIFAGGASTPVGGLSIDGAGTAASFQQPYGLAVDGSGNIYVAEFQSLEIRKITPIGVVSTIVSGSGQSVSGNFPLPGIGNVDIALNLGQYTGIAVDATGKNIYFSRIGKNDILKMVTTGYSINPSLPLGLNFDINGLTIFGTPYSANPATNYTFTGYNIGGSSSATINLTQVNSVALTFGTINPVNYGTSDFSPGATSSQAITYSSDNSNVATIVSGLIHVVGAGTATISATDGTTTLTQTLTVNAVPLTITAANQTRLEGAGNPTFTVSYSGFVNGDTQASLTALPTISTTADVSSSAGTYPITATGALDNNYSISYIPGTLTITAVAPLVFTTIPPATYGAADFSPPATSGSAITYTSSNTSVATIVSGNIHIVGSGTTTITAVSNGTTLTQTLTVAASTLTITANDQNRAFGSANPTFTVTYSGFVNGDTPASLTTLPTISTIATISSPAGTYPITASGAASLNYTFNYVAGTLTVISQLAPNISYTGPQSYPINTVIVPLPPNNKGGAVPATTYGKVSTLAGSGATGSTNGTGIGASFNTPENVVTDAAGNIYVTDGGNNLIRKITPGGVVTVFAGSGAQGSSNGLAATASFNGPNGITIDPSGNFYVADAGNNLIRKITPAGIVSTYAGNGAYGSSNGPAISASFSFPTGVTTDNQGNVYVADRNSNLIRKISGDGVVSTFAGSGVQGSAIGIGIAASFNGPTGITTDVVGNIYVADQGGAMIRKISSTGLVSNLAGSGAQAYADGSGILASFNSPTGVTTDAFGNVYVADNGNSMVRKITPAGIVSTLAGNANVGSLNAVGTNASFNYLTDVTTDAYGNLYVADQSNNLIRKISLTGYSISPALPTGLTFDATTGVFRGTPTVVSPPTDYTVTAYNTGGSSTTTVNIGTSNITFAALPAVKYGAADFSPGAVSSQVITYASSNLAVATIVNNMIHIIGAGTSTITASSGGTSLMQTLTVSRVNLSIKADNTSKLLGQPNPAFTVSYTGFVNGDTQASLTTLPAISCLATTSSPAGYYNIIPSGAVDNNYNINYVTGNLTITQTPFVFNTIPTKTYGTADFSPRATATSAITYNSDNAKVATIVSGQVHIVGTGTANITAINAGIAIKQTLTVNPAVLTITADNQSRVVGAANPVLTITYSGFVNGDSPSNLAKLPLIATTATVKSVPGTYDIVVYDVGGIGGNYTPNYVKGTLTISKANLTVTANNLSKTYGTNNPALTISYTGLVPGDDPKYFTAKPTASTAVTVTSPVGVYPITVSGMVDVNYNITYVNGTFTVSPVTGAAFISASPVTTDFELTTTSTTCEGMGDGIVNIKAVKNSEYTATITGNGLSKTYDFTDTATIRDLAAGEYEVSITSTGQSNEFHYNIVISDPKPLLVYADVDNSKRNITLSLRGGNAYNIQLNGRQYATTESNFVLPLQLGNNKLLVTTDKECQGIFEKQVNPTAFMTPYPMPFQSTLNINLGENNIGHVQVNIFDTQTGKLVYTNKYDNQSGILQLPVDALDKGVYGLHLLLDNEETVFKVIK